VRPDLDKLPPVFWLTRDTLRNELNLAVDVWVVQPKPHRYEDGDVVWYAPSGESHVGPDCIGDLPADEAARAFGTVPTDLFECVRVGPGPAKASA